MIALRLAKPQSQQLPPQGRGEADNDLVIYECSDEVSGSILLGIVQCACTGPVVCVYCCVPMNHELAKIKVGWSCS